MSRGLRSIAETARAMNLNSGTVLVYWRRGMKKLGLDQVPQEELDRLARRIRNRRVFERMLEPKSLIGCGSVECRRDWIERFGDYFEL